MYAVDLNNITKQYGNHRGIKNITFQVKKGQIMGLLGPNGSGKTTIMKVMTGLVFPDSGECKIFGSQLSDNRIEVLKETGCLLEHTGFYPYLTARQNLEVVKRLYPDCPKARIDDILEQVGLFAYQDEKVKRYSLGMKQRLGIAMAMISNPDLLILDEPFNALDIEGMAKVKQMIRHESLKGKTVLLSSHLAAELEQVCTHIAIMKNGNLIEVADTNHVVREYGSLERYYLSLVNRKQVKAS